MHGINQTLILWCLIQGNPQYHDFYNCRKNGKKNAWQFDLWRAAFAWCLPLLWCKSHLHFRSSPLCQGFALSAVFCTKHLWKYLRSRLLWSSWAGQCLRSPEWAMVRWVCQCFPLHFHLIETEFELIGVHFTITVVLYKTPEESVFSRQSVLQLWFTS